MPTDVKVFRITLSCFIVNGLRLVSLLESSLCISWQGKKTKKNVRRGQVSSVDIVLRR